MRTRYALADWIYQDYHYRTVLFTAGSFLNNIFYAVSKLLMSTVVRDGTVIMKYFSIKLSSYRCMVGEFFCFIENINWRHIWVYVPFGSD